MHHCPGAGFCWQQTIAAIRRCCPQVEAFFDGGLAVALFNMPVLLAFTLGFILKAVGPGLVVPAMFHLQKTGLGRDQGEPGRRRSGPVWVGGWGVGGWKLWFAAAGRQANAVIHHNMNAQA
jgi:hypothetical protein